MCLDRSRYWPRSYGWQTDRGRLSGTLATLSVRKTQHEEELVQNTDPLSVRISPHLMSLVDDDGVIGQRLHDVEVFNSS